MIDTYKALILAIIEGFTEFLPISSTAHLLFAAKILDFTSIPNHSFEIIIQLAAILPLFIIYRDDLFNPLKNLSKKNNRDFYLKFFIALLPIVLIGGYFGSFIKAKIFDIKFIASSLILGGVIMVFIEKLLPKSDIKKIDQIGFKKSFYIGLFQVFALIPGMSRAGSSIIGAMILGVDRLTAAKFSFFLAIPTICAATVYDIYKNYHNFVFDDILILTIGFVMTFFTAYLVILNFTRIMSSLGFKIIGAYRILIGSVMFIWNYWF
ncbi:MAG: undecaprenyl-diphosphate phosphatase [Rickettsiales bacterium]|nr:undecaprenyl-diphosphate phosphatase [Rickettsiales bacterium]